MTEYTLWTKTGRADWIAAEVQGRPGLAELYFHARELRKARTVDRAEVHGPSSRPAEDLKD